MAKKKLSKAPTKRAKPAPSKAKTSLPAFDDAQVVSAVEKKIEKVRTRVLDVSFNELYDMFITKDLIIGPAYQRLFRWGEDKQSRFIETLILEMPVPPVYVIEQESGQYELIDGLQRISSYLHFRGVHPDKVDETGKMTSLKLLSCDIVPELNSQTFDSLPTVLKMRLKRNFIRVEVLRKESDQRLKYYMFKRLNTGGASLSEQEIRNCTIRLLDEKFNQFIVGLTDFAPFKDCISYVTDEKLTEKYDQELVLRFFAFKNWSDNYVKDVGAFMTDYMENVADPDEGKRLPFDYDAEEEVFRKTFTVLSKSIGAQTCSAANSKGTLISSFAIYHYETISIGIQSILPKLNPDDAAQMKRLKEALLSIKQDAAFRKMTTGGGKNYAKQYGDRIKKMRAHLKDFK